MPADGGGGGGGGGDAMRGGDGGGGGGGGIDAPPAPSQVSIIVEPNGQKAQELIDAINAAQHTIDMTMYEIDNTGVLSALVARANAGVTVKAVLDGSSTCKSFNTPAYNQLQAAGVSVVWSSSSFTYTHEKTVIIDGTTAWIMSMNLTKSSPQYNREYLAIDTSAADIAEATAIFNADHALQSITPSGSLVVAPTNARDKLVQLIESATKNIDVEVEELSDLNSNGVVQALQYAAQHGVTVRAVLAGGTPTTNQTTAISRLKTAGASVVVTGPNSGSGTSTNPYIHAKAMVIDCVSGTCASGFVGSENFSGGSLGYNRELGVIFDEPSQLSKVESTIAGDFARGTPQ